MEEVTRCRYIGCAESIAHGKEQILHEVPVDDTKLSVKWLINSGNVEFVAEDLDALCSKKFFICNNHFTDDCYLTKGTLKENALPTPHWSPTSRMIKASRIRRKIRLNGDQHGGIAAANKFGKITKFVDRNGSAKFEADECCRTCARKKIELISMNSKQKGTEMSLLSKLKLLIEIDDEDALPTKMCSECVLKLEQCFKFFQQIYIADNALRQLFPKQDVNGIGTIRENQCIPIKQPVEIYRETRISPERIDSIVDVKQTPNVCRGGPVRRGRGRPRTRGSVARTRARLRPRQIDPPFNPPHSVSAPTLLSQVESGRVSVSPKREKRAETVFALLTDTCRSDEELDWSDVLMLMNRTTKLQPAKNPKGRETDSEKQISEKGIHCEFCNDVFKFRRQLRSHLLTDHTHLARYMCPDCVACYDTETLLENHRSLRHGDRRYRCDYCFRDFFEKRMLREHVIECHVSPPQTNSETKPEKETCDNLTCYSCDSCGKTFPSKTILVDHVEIHQTSATSFLRPSSFNTGIDRDNLSKPLHLPGTDQRDGLHYSALDVDNVPVDTNVNTNTNVGNSNVHVEENTENNEADSIVKSNTNVDESVIANGNARINIDMDLNTNVDGNLNVNADANINVNLNADADADAYTAAEIKINLNDDVETKEKEMLDIKVVAASQIADKTINNDKATEDAEESNIPRTQYDSTKRKDLSSRESLSSNEDEEREQVLEPCKRLRVSSR